MTDTTAAAGPTAGRQIPVMTLRKSRSDPDERYRDPRDELGPSGQMEPGDWYFQATAIAVIGLAALLVAILVWLPRDPVGGLAAYLPFHMFAETCSIVVSAMIFSAMWNAYSPERAAGLVVLSCSMLATGLLDFGHMLSVSRMPDFITPASPDKGIAFWLAARLTAAVGIFGAAMYASRPLRRPVTRYVLLFAALVIAALTYWTVLFHPSWLPRFFLPGVGLLPIKVGIEYTVIAILVLPAVVFYRRARQSRSRADIALAAAVAVSMLSEFYFALYAAAHDLFQVLGHTYKVIAFGFVYSAVYVVSVREPTEALRRSERALRRNEAELRDLNATLEERVHRRTTELEMANKELEAFAYSVSHDLRAPLRAIDGFSRKVVLNYGDRLDEEGRRQLAMVRDNAQRMSKLIEDLLAFSRMGRREMARQAVDMEAVARSVVDELRAGEPQRAVELAIRSLPPARGDEVMLRQVWANLLANAFKFTSRRPVAHVEIGGREEDGEAIYWVKDDGAGFDMQYADKLFGVFQRLHGQDEFEGTGVGLAIAQRILLRHGGRIWAEGKPEAGATFWFSLPLRRDEGD